MSLAFKAVMGLLIFLACSSGLAKMSLMQQDVEFFGGYGFSNEMLIVFGAAQFIGGIMLLIGKTRLVGASIVLVTFAISAALLFIAGNVGVALVTIGAIALLVYVMKSSMNTRSALNT